MFQFGIFASQITYLIMVAVLSVYFVTYSLNKYSQISNLSAVSYHTCHLESSSLHYYQYREDTGKENIKNHQSSFLRKNELQHAQRVRHLKALIAFKNSPPSTHFVVTPPANAPPCISILLM